MMMTVFKFYLSIIFSKIFTIWLILRPGKRLSAGQDMYWHYEVYMCESKTHPQSTGPVGQSSEGI